MDDQEEAQLPEENAVKDAPVEVVKVPSAERCAICGGLNPGDISHTRCM